MTPHLRRLTTAVAVLLTTTSLIAFGVGRVTGPSEAERNASRTMGELAAFRAAEHEAFLRAKESGYAAGLINGGAAGRRVGEARGEAMRAATQTAAAADTHPHVDPAPSTDGAEEGCCPASSAGSQMYASQDGLTGDGEDSSQAMLASEADSSRRTSTTGDGRSADHSDSSSWHTDSDPTGSASAEPVVTAQRPRASEAGWAETNEARGAADDADYAEDAEETYDAEETEKACDADEPDEPDEPDEADEDYDIDEARDPTEADRTTTPTRPTEADEAATLSENAYSKR